MARRDKARVMPEWIGDAKNRVSEDGEILEAVNIPMHHLLCYEEERLDRGNTRPSVAKTSRNSKRPFTDVSEPGTTSGLEHSSRSGIIR